MNLLLSPYSLSLSLFISTRLLLPCFDFVVERERGRFLIVAYRIRFIVSPDIYLLCKLKRQNAISIFLASKKNTNTIVRIIDQLSFEKFDSC